jgi:coenzyme F420-dependent glucose-6-phosphate dehydrogenase
LPRIKISVNLGEGYNDPKRFVECTVIAEKYGFETVWFGDHLSPWVHNQNKSAFAWSVMPSALERTKRIKVGVLVTSPIGGRYHPLVIGQAAATLDNMYPGRFQLGVGSGEAISEAKFFSNGWPNWQERIDRLSEAVVLIKNMWQSEEYFTYQGKYFKIKDFFLYTKPKTEIPIYFAAQGRKAAEYAGIYGDHLVTINSPETCQNIIFPSFEQSAKKAGKTILKMEKMVEVLLYFSEKDGGVYKIRMSGEAGFLARGSFNEVDPRKIQQMSYEVNDKTILANICFCPSPEDIIETIEKYCRAGATHIELVTNSFPERIEFIGKKVLPYFVENEKYRLND